MYVVILSVARKKRLSDLRTCRTEVVDLEKPKTLLKSRMFKVDRNITIIISKRSLRGAMSKATRWINNNLFKSDCNRIEKDAPLTKWSKQVTWRIY